LKTEQSPEQLKYVEVEVLPRQGQAQYSSSTDPFIEFVSRLLDSIFYVPGTRIRFGFAPIIGLIPILGNQAASLISSALLYRSVQHRLPKIALVRMALNILINGVFGMVPLIGNLFVLWHKPNIRNYRILQRYAGHADAVTKNDSLFVSLLIGITFFLIVCITILLTYALLSASRAAWPR
jgi:Domain of unknown function (DUF4112)